MKFEFLIKVAASEVNTPGLYGMTALHVAAKDGDLPRLIQLMQISGIALDQKDNAGLSALGWANRKRQTESARLLLQAGARFEDSSD